MTATVATSHHCHQKYLTVVAKAATTITEIAATTAVETALTTAAEKDRRHCSNNRNISKIPIAAATTTVAS